MTAGLTPVGDHGGLRATVMLLDAQGHRIEFLGWPGDSVAQLLIGAPKLDHAR